MSDEFQEVEEEEVVRNRKIDPDDPALDVVEEGGNRLNKKMLKAIFAISAAALGGIFMFSLNSKMNQEAAEAEGQTLTKMEGVSIPGSLIPGEDDYRSGYGGGGQDQSGGESGMFYNPNDPLPSQVIYVYGPDNRVYNARTGEVVETFVDENGNIVLADGTPITILQPDQAQAALAGGGTSSYAYEATYDTRTPTPTTPVEVDVRQSPFSRNTSNSSSGDSASTRTGSVFAQAAGAMSPEQQMLQSARGAPIAYQTGAVSENSGQGALDPAIQLAQIQMDQQLITDMSRQNQQQQKLDFLSSRNQDIDNYLSTYYTDAVEPTLELKEGSLIPIILEVRINTDLPGPVRAKVMVDVYDSLTGTNLLLPAGSTALGTYSSELSFGQERALIVWDRIIRPDGVSLNLLGMQGVDNTGSAGMTGDVDFHYDDVIAGVAMATGFDFATNAVIAGMSSVPALRSLGGMLAEGDESQAAQDVVSQYTQKMMNRQPTIIIEMGTQGLIYVNKDIILPPYRRTY
jgi:type IV secretory pathway VirB10-like protein